MASKDNLHTLYIMYGGKWIEKSGIHVYESQEKPFVIGWENMNYEFISGLAQIYCNLSDDGGLLYLPPNGNPSSDLRVISKEKDIPVLLESQGSCPNIELFVVPPLTQEECLKDPFMMRIRNKMVEKAKAGRRKEPNIDIGKKRDNGKEKVPVRDKGKKPVVEEDDSDDSIFEDDVTLANLLDELKNFRFEGETSEDSVEAGPSCKEGAKTRNEDGHPKQKSPIEKEWPWEVPGFGPDLSDCRSDTLEMGGDQVVQDDATTCAFYKHYKDEKNSGDFELQLGMLFGSREAFKQAMRDHAIFHGYDIVIPMNNKIRMEVYCTHKCGFRVIARTVNKESTVQIRDLVKEHNCPRSHINHNVGYKWVCDHFIGMLRDDPKIRNRTIRGEILRRYGWKVNRFVVARGMKLAKDKLAGDRIAEYGRVRDYAATLIEHNPGTTVVVHVDSISSPLRPRFERLYVCLDACKQGFLKGCRPFIALDGCFLKGPDGGQLLCAVTRDPDNGLLPIAFAWVEAENQQSQ